MRKIARKLWPLSSMEPVQEAHASSAPSDSLASEPSEVCSHMSSQASSSGAESDESDVSLQAGVDLTLMIALTAVR